MDVVARLQRALPPEVSPAQHPCSLHRARCAGMRYPPGAAASRAPLLSQYHTRSAAMRLFEISSGGRGRQAFEAVGQFDARGDGLLSAFALTAWLSWACATHGAAPLSDKEFAALRSVLAIDAGRLDDRIRRV